MTAYDYSLLAALVWGVAPLLEKYGIARVDPMTGLVARCAGVFAAGLALFYWLPGRRIEIRSIPAPILLCFAAAGILASVVGQIFAYNAIRRADVSQVTPIMGAWPLLTVLLGWLLLKEPLTLNKILGSGCVVLGLWLLRFR